MAMDDLHQLGGISITQGGRRCLECYSAVVQPIPLTHGKLKMPFQEFYAADDSNQPLPDAQALRIERKGRKFRALVLSTENKHGVRRVLNPDAPWVGSRNRALAVLAETHPQAAKLG